MLQALVSLNTLTASVQTGSQEMNKGNQTLVQETSRLREATGLIEAAMQGITTSIENLGHAGRHLDTLVTQTVSAIDGMEGAVGKFKVEG